ncbi:SH3 domain-containing protein [Duganella sp. BuS-21]|uniref:SH3 domain-containing protein n=1 Tax=Duganella sp. BuS-21 TaxID=2943848 RepID=UPI0035A6FBF7
MEAVNLHTVAGFGAGLVVTLFLAAYLTPRAWWRRANARALLIAAVGTWSIGSLILYATHTPAAASVNQPAAMARVQAPAAQRNADPTTNAHAATAGHSFRVHRDLNLRAAPGVHAARIAVVPAGATVTPTGQHDGDWWQIKATVNGSEASGWASSLWLRRGGE